MCKRPLSLLLLAVMMAGCATSPQRQVAASADAVGRVRPLSKAQLYFLEVALQSEFGSTEQLIRRWERPLRLYIDGHKPPELLAEMHTVVEELRQLLPSLDIGWAQSAQAANVLVFFGPYKEYARRYAPKARERLRRNWGYFTVQWSINERGIKSASLYVDTDRARDDDQRAHLLREEFTQVLGLMADSKRYPDSIFYQHWSTTTAYSELDKQLIQMLYSDEIQSGMDESAVKAVWRMQDSAAMVGVAAGE